MRILKRCFAGLIALSVVFGSCCAVSIVWPDDAQAATTLNNTQIKKALTQERASKVSTFGVKALAKLSRGKSNTCVSPISILNAIGMTQNGADGKTLAQMQSMTGLSTRELNQFVCAYDTSVKRASTKRVSFKSANSIWFNTASQCTLKRSFRKKVSKYYGAKIVKQAFDSNTAGNINAWVSRQTDGMVKKIVNELSGDAVSVLVNALAFDARWAITYDESSIHKQVFTNASGTKVKVDFLCGEESKYINDGSATGFVKPYAGGKFKFVALVPNKTTTLNSYLKKLSKKSFPELVSSASNTRVITAMPKFSYDCNVSLNDTLKKLGMKQAFSKSKANFTKMATTPPGENICVSDVLHATHIDVNALGTKAAASTAVIMAKNSAILQPCKKVVLNRPFVYAIVDAQTNTPLFLGCVKTLQSS